MAFFVYLLKTPYENSLYKHFVTKLKFSPTLILCINYIYVIALSPNKIVPSYVLQIFIILFFLIIKLYSNILKYLNKTTLNT